MTTGGSSSIDCRRDGSRCRRRRRASSRRFTDRHGRAAGPACRWPSPTVRRVDVAIKLLPGAVITGVITDGRGNPAPGVTVAAVETRPSGGAALAPVRVVTDDRGVYRIFGLAPGEYLVSALPQLGPASAAARRAGRRGRDGRHRRGCAMGESRRRRDGTSRRRERPAARLSQRVPSRTRRSSIPAPPTPRRRPRSAWPAAKNAPASTCPCGSSRSRVSPAPSSTGTDSR